MKHVMSVILCALLHVSYGQVDSIIKPNLVLRYSSALMKTRLVDTGATKQIFIFTPKIHAAICIVYDAKVEKTDIATFYNNFRNTGEGTLIAITYKDLTGQLLVRPNTSLIVDLTNVSKGGLYSVIAYPYIE